MPFSTALGFKEAILEGIPLDLPAPANRRDPLVGHAPKRNLTGVLSNEEKMLAVQNALRYFPQHQHPVLAREFAEELDTYGRIYMYRFKPDYPMFARPQRLC